MAQHNKLSCKNIEKFDFVHPKLRGHVSVAKPNEDYNGMDMRVHLKLKSNERTRSRPRSQSLSRNDGFRKRDNLLFLENNCIQRNLEMIPSGNDPKGKSWNDILRSQEVPPSRKNRHSKNKSVSSSAEDGKNTNNIFCNAGNGQVKESVQQIQNPEDVHAFSLFNPVRTLQFLIFELRSTVKPQGERQDVIFTLMEQILAKLPQSPPISDQQKSTVSLQRTVDDNLPLKPNNQFSRTGFEHMRKERDTLQKELNEKSKSHIALERKVAILEAKLHRVKTERNELRGVNEKLIYEQKALISTLHMKGKENSDEQVVTKLFRELNSANECISKLQADILILKKQYNSKMKEVQGILHDGFDFSKNDSMNLGDVLGQPPDEEHSLLEPGHLTAPNDIPHISNVRPASPEPPLTASPLLAFTDLDKINVEECLNNIVHQNGVIQAEQLSVFQSFFSIPDNVLQTDK